MLIKTIEFHRNLFSNVDKMICNSILDIVFVVKLQVFDQTCLINFIHCMILKVKEILTGAFMKIWAHF